jgi:hypothetical protein
MPRKISWTTLHKKSAGERAQIAIDALYAARQKGASYFKEDGTITLRPQELFAKLFDDEKVDTRRAGNLVSLLRDRDVIRSNGKRGRGGATLRLNGDTAPTEPFAKKTQPEKGAVTKVSDSSGPEKTLTENVDAPPIKALTVRQVREQFHRRLHAARHEYAASKENLSHLEAAVPIVNALDDDMNPAALKGALATINTIFD